MYGIYSDSFGPNREWDAEMTDMNMIFLMLVGTLNCCRQSLNKTKLYQRFDIRTIKVSFEFDRSILTTKKSKNIVLEYEFTTMPSFSSCLHNAG